MSLYWIHTLLTVPSLARKGLYLLFCFAHIQGTMYAAALPDLTEEIRVMGEDKKRCDASRKPKGNWLEKQSISRRYPVSSSQRGPRIVTLSDLPPEGKDGNKGYESDNKESQAFLDHLELVNTLKVIDEQEHLLKSNSCKSLSTDNIKSELSLALLTYDNGYRGLKVNIDVFAGAEKSRRRLWYGTLKFGTFSTVHFTKNPFPYRRRYASKVKFVYRTTDLYNRCLEQIPPPETNAAFTHGVSTVHSYDEAHIEGSNFVTWQIRGKISIPEVIQRVSRLRDETVEFPQYKLIGYDDYHNVANCATFSCRFIKALGVNLEECTMLNRWLSPMNSSSIVYYSYYILAGGFARDNIQAHHVLSEIKSRDHVLRWRWLPNEGPAAESDAPIFNYTNIRSSFGRSFANRLKRLGN